MTTKMKLGIGTFFFAMLLVCLVFIPAVSAQENIKTSDNPSELEQGLINELNSNTNNLSTESVITNYIQINKNKIPKIDDNRIRATLGSSNERSYKLNNGDTITFTSGDLFSITGVTAEPLEKAVSTVSTNGYSRTPTLKAWHDFYSWNGKIRIYSLYTRGYFEYNGKKVKNHYIDSWYKRGFCSVWQVSQWEEGGTDQGTTAQIYGRGEFYVTINIGVGEVVVQDTYNRIWLTCDKKGKWAGYYSESKS